MVGCLYTFFMIPFYMIYYIIVATFYVMYYGAIACYYIFGFVVALIVSIVKAIFNGLQNKKVDNNRYNTAKNDALQNSPVVPKKVADLKQEKLKEPYILAKVEKSVGRTIFRNDEINYEELGIESFYCPSSSVYFDEEKYYEIEIYEYPNDLAGKLLNAMFKKFKEKMTVVIGENSNNIKYRYKYKDGEVIVNELTSSQKKSKNNMIRKEYDILKQGIDDRVLMDDDSNALDNELQVYGIESDDFYSVENYLEDDYLIYEWYYVEQILPIVASISLEPKYKPLPNIQIIEVEEPSNNSTFKSNFNKNKKSWKEEEFNKQTDLWGLSEEDRRIAKQERMSPADYVEAEEYDDDELLKDDWDR